MGVLGQIWRHNRRRWTLLHLRVAPARLDLNRHRVLPPNRPPPFTGSGRREVAHSAHGLLGRRLFQRDPHRCLISLSSRILDSARVGSREYDERGTPTSAVVPSHTGLNPRASPDSVVTRHLMAVGTC